MNNVLKKERWLPLWFTNAKYQVSNFGRVRSVFYISKYGVIRFTGTILKTSVNSRGYEKVRLQWATSEGEFIKKTMAVHRLVGIAWIPNPEGKREINHKDLNQLNNHFRNLEWATPKENTHHAQRMGARPIKKPYVKKGWSVKPVIDMQTGIYWTTDDVAFLIGVKRRYVQRMLSEGRKPNTSQYRYA